MFYIGSSCALSLIKLLAEKADLVKKAEELNQRVKALTAACDPGGVASATGGMAASGTSSVEAG